MPGHSLLKQTDPSLTSWVVLVTGTSVLVFLGPTPVSYSVSGLLVVVFNLDIAFTLMLPWNFKNLTPSGESPAHTWYNSALGGLGKHCRATELIPAFTSLHLASLQAPLQECQDGERGSRETFAETELPLCLTDTDLSTSLGLGDGCYIGQGQPGFLCTLLSATARVGLRL